MRRSALAATAAASRSTPRRRPSTATWSNALRVEVGVELAVEHRQHVAVELGGHAGGVVVGRDEPVDVLHEVGAEQQRVAGREPWPRGRRGTGRAASGARLPMVLAEERDDAACRRRGGRRGGARSRRRPRARATPGYSSATAAAASRSVCSLTSKGTKRSSVPASRSASSSSRVFSDVPEPSSTSVSALVSSAMVAGVRHEDRPLGAGRVVLGEPGDLVEQLAAALVVEPLRRQRLRRGRQPGAHVGFEGARRGRRARGARRR